jgi:hypothetical protein
MTERRRQDVQRGRENHMREGWFEWRLKMIGCTDGSHRSIERRRIFS